MERITPCNVLFDTLKSFGSVSNKNAARIILSDKQVAGGRSPRERIDDPSYLSRVIVRSEPGDCPESMFASFQVSAYSILSRMSSNVGGPEAVIAYLSRQGRDDMVSALDAYGMDGRAYANASDKIAAMPSMSAQDRAGLLTLLFLVAGCTGDPRRALGYTFAFAGQVLGNEARTSALDTNTFDLDEGQRKTRLALFRVVDGVIRPTAYPLYEGEGGTEIGYLSSSEHSINDVEQTVSRRHLHIWLDKAGRWVAEGLNSRNGTMLIRADGTAVVIEPPRDGRQGFVSRPVPIEVGDTLALARDTLFQVVYVDA